MNDTHNMRGFLEGFPDQCEEALGLGKGVGLPEPNGITVTGMGGSGFAGDVLRCIFWGRRDILVNKGYGIPPSVGKGSLVIAASFSGNTEETLESCEKALSRGADVVGISKGGKLAELCSERGLPFVKLPHKEGLQPRNALGYLLMPILNMLQESSGLEAGAVEAAKSLREPGIREKGREMAARMAGKTVAAYAPEELYCIALGWCRQRLNEIAKAPAFFGTFPEATHNELSAYQLPQPGLHAVFFMDADGDSRTRRRMELCGELMGESAGTSTLELRGSPLAKILTALHAGDWAAYHLAASQGIDPTEVPLQDRVKRAMQGIL